MPISTAIKDGLAEGTGEYATLVKVTPVSGSSLAYALHTADVVFEGTTYTAAPFDPSKLSQSAGVSVDNATVTHLLNELFSRLNIKGRKWAGAVVQLLAVDLRRLTAGPVRKHIGRLGDVTIRGQEAQSEFRGLMTLLNQEIGDRTSRRCRYQLGDADCMVNLAGFTFSGTVTAVVTAQRITVTISQPDGYFKYGRIIFTSGSNAGLTMETINNTGQTITLFLPMPGAIGIGDGVQLIAGDDKLIQTCHGKFANAINFGGEPAIPRKEDLFTFPQ